MSYRFRLNLDKMVSLTSFTAFGFPNPTDFENCSVSPIASADLLGCDKAYGQNHLSFLYNDGSQGYDLELWGDSQVLSFSSTSTYVTFRAEMPQNYIMFQGILDAISLGIVELLQDDDEKGMSVVTYRQVSDNDKLDKELVAVGLMKGNLNHSIGLRSMDLDIEGYGRDFNYVYLPKFSRYYYVDSIELASAEITRLHLKEDVLMSHKDLIRSQTAFIERQENVYDPDLVDEMVKYSYDKNIITFQAPLVNDIYAVSNADLDFVIETVGG